MIFKYIYSLIHKYLLNITIYLILGWSLGNHKKQGITYDIYRSIGEVYYVKDYFMYRKDKCTFYFLYLVQQQNQQKIFNIFSIIIQDRKRFLHVKTQYFPTSCPWLMRQSLSSLLPFLLIINLALLISLYIFSLSSVLCLGSVVEEIFCPVL